MEVRQRRNLAKRGEVFGDLWKTRPWAMSAAADRARETGQRQRVELVDPSSGYRFRIVPAKGGE